jgi:hypothetical protein
MSDNFVNNINKYLDVYQFETVLPGCKKKVKFKPLVTKQLKGLLVYKDENDPAKLEEALDYLLLGSIIDEDFNINDLYLQDRHFLLLEIRKRTMGSGYKFTYKCPDCKSQSLKTINLDNLEVIQYPDKVDDIVKLDDNLKVRLKHITRGEQKEAYKKLESGVLDDNRLFDVNVISNACSIVSIFTPEGEDSNINIDQKIYFIENIPRGMYEKITEWLSKNEFGLKFNVKIKCNNPECNKEKEVDVPFDSFFFT